MIANDLLSAIRSVAESDVIGVTAELGRAQCQELLASLEENDIIASLPCSGCGAPAGQSCACSAPALAGHVAQSGLAPLPTLAEVWARFAAATMQLGVERSTTWRVTIADELLEEYRRRWLR